MLTEDIIKTVTISKDELAQLPVVEYHNGIIVIDSPEKIDKATEILEKQRIIGFDTETKPNFKRGQINKVSLLQLSTHEECFLIRLNKVGLPDPIKNILENPEIIKIGLSIHDDFHSLNKIFSLEPNGFIELQTYVKEFNIHDNSLARIYAILFDKRISKGQRLTNWEAEELTEHQQAYASLDALACIHIYEYLNSGKFRPEESLYYRILETQVPQTDAEKIPKDEKSVNEESNKKESSKKKRTASRPKKKTAKTADSATRKKKVSSRKKNDIKENKE